MTRGPRGLPPIVLWGIYVSWIFMLGVAVLFASKFHHKDAALFVWGVGIGAVGAVGNVWYRHLLLRLVAAHTGDAGLARERMTRVPGHVTAIGMVVVGVVVGTIAARTGEAWFDIAFTAMFVVFFVVPVVLGLLFFDRLLARSARGGTRRPPGHP